jgi:hypothetical protein
MVDVSAIKQLIWAVVPDASIDLRYVLAGVLLAAYGWWELRRDR